MIIDRPQIDQQRIETFAKYVSTAPVEASLNFYSFLGGDGSEIIASDMYPPLQAPGTIDHFFFVGIHNFGFWTARNKKYQAPLIGTLAGKKVKGSDLLHKLILREYVRDHHHVSPTWLASVQPDAFTKMFSDDEGRVPLLATRERMRLTRRYGQWFERSRPWGTTPKDLVTYAMNSPTPGQALLGIITDPAMGIPGYREDPLRKKATLLLMSLVNRPEKFIVLEDGFRWPPIVDYHLMRLALRLGLISLPCKWESENRDRICTSAEREAVIRRAVYDAVNLIIRISGRTMPEIDNLMWSARRYCPEMTQPDCTTCALASACAKRTELFQPVFRTDMY